ncbi:hypothetical protein MAE02_27780 [Microvirga aerophila]|uniref:Uncharacterized protein n=1 Tax=Microvirga aerophila TaxID=670291 RepID=A0A512BT30_9HYPH|nr:hypothetical protein MAE02_27780 [Microvirga aerophila]
MFPLRTEYFDIILSYYSYMSIHAACVDVARKRGWEDQAFARAGMWSTGSPGDNEARPSAVRASLEGSGKPAQT